MKKINKLLIILMILITIGVSIFDYRIDRVFTYILLIPTLLVPLLCKKIKIKLNNLDIMIYYIFILVVQVLGCICNLYNIIWWYDLFAHFISGIFTFYIGLILLKNFKINIKDKFIFILFFCICFSALIALLWEIIEFTGDSLFNLNVQHSKTTGVTDTMQDMIIAMIGTVITTIIYYLKNKCIITKIW